MKNTMKILLCLVQEDRELNRDEISVMTSLSKGVLDGTLHFLKKKELIKVRYISTNKLPYRRAKYNLNPKKGDIIIKLLEKEGIELV